MTLDELREKVAHVLDRQGAQTGECGHEPGRMDECANGCRELLLSYADALIPLFASVWDEGATYAAVECGAIDREENAWVAPGDNPYRETK